MAKFKAARADIAGNGFNKAYNLGTFRNSSVIIDDFVGNSDRADYFKINFASRCYSAIMLSNLQANADIDIYNSDRQLVSRLNRSGTIREFSASNGFNSPSGVFFLKVYPRGASDTTYRLTILTATES
jgi:hypothetical protein